MLWRVFVPRYRKRSHARDADGQQFWILMDLFQPQEESSFFFFFVGRPKKWLLLLLVGGGVGSSKRVEDAKNGPFFQRSYR